MILPIGTLTNVAAIVVGTLIGVGLGKRIPTSFERTIRQSLGLGVFAVGLKLTLAEANLVLIVVSLAVGGVLGEALNIEERLNRIGSWFRRITRAQNDQCVGAFVTATLIYCIGAMSIVGSFEEGMRGDPTILYTKAALDGITAVVLATSLGVGVAFSAISVYIFQGSITLLAALVGKSLSPEVIAHISSCGGLLILAIAINFFDPNRIRVGNLLPALAIAALLAQLVYLS